MDRRDFLNLGGASVAGIALRARAQEAGFKAQEPDLVVFNAKVYTVDDRLPKAEAFAVKGGRFVAVGSNAEIKGLIGRKTQSYDAHGMTVVPGFIDTHNHGGGEGLMYHALVGNPYDVEFVTIQSVIDKLQARARTLPTGTWVEGFFFDDTKLKDSRPLNAQDLDKVSTEHPVVVRHRGGHTNFYNSKAFQMAGITKDTPNPPGGTFDKNEQGELNGRVTDRARVVLDKVGSFESFTPAVKEKRVLDGVAFMSKKFVEYGLTSVHHDEVGVLMAMQEQRVRGGLLHRVNYEPGDKLTDQMIDAGIESGFGDEWIRLGATSEHLVDGSLSERTMAMSRPFVGISPPYYGNLIQSQEDLNAWAERVHRAGIRLNCHANGDVAIDRTLTAYERALKLYPRPDVRPKISHCSLVNADLVRRMKALNVVPAEFSTYPYYNSDKFHFYGEELMKNMTAMRSLLDAGIVASGGSDFSPGPFSPLMAVQAMVTRTGWNGETWGANQRISVDEALRVNTLNGAYNSLEEGIKGSITPGKLADFVVLANDPHTVEPGKIKDIQIVKTVVGGATVYQA
ncbi:amidohydrolase [Granulicella sp. WH15]|uniref:amidohydrolase n=1 Tax=Granulicella sp. WH15 TaxID=2602070 RepID=UPI001367663B|nr:amidohydrolase [Granulicella sp. WH15]QHN04264.1 amidohydrolase [Granulicella sp. WH15]